MSSRNASVSTAPAAVCQHEHDLREKSCDPLGERQQDQEHELAQLGVDLACHAEVEEVDLLVPPLHISWVRVGVEEPFHNHLVVVRLEELAGCLLPRRPVGCLPYGDALNLLHHQQPRCRVLLVDIRHVQPRKRRQHLSSS
jgi:hypothetical protein